MRGGNGERGGITTSGHGVDPSSSWLESVTNGWIEVDATIDVSMV